MIYDKLENFALYGSAHPLFGKVEEFIKLNDIDIIAPGRYEMESGCYYMVSEEMTRSESECFLECHKKYIDIQVAVNGHSEIGFVFKDKCTSDGYQENKDFEVMHGEYDKLNFSGGSFAVFFPWDAHMPMINSPEGPETQKKIVFKVPYKI